MGRNIRYCTWAKSGDSPELALLIHSARRFGITIDVMPCGGFLDKPAALLKYLSKLEDSELVLATDGYDVLYVQDEESILASFRAMNSPIVIGGETGCFHHFADAMASFDRTPDVGPFRYLNSGLIMGYVKEVRDMLETVLSQREALRLEYARAEKTPGFFNDQTIIGRIASKAGNVRIDANADLFCTFCEEKYDIDHWVDISESGITLKQTGSRPCLVHVSHRQKFYAVYLYIASRIGLDLSTDTTDWRLLRKYLETGETLPDRKSISMNREFEIRISTMLEAQKLQASQCDHVGIVFIGTGKYFHYFDRFYESISDLFLPGVKKTFYVFSDGVGPHIYQYENVVPLPTPAQKWPFTTLYRFRYLKNSHELWRNTSHMVYFDADTLVFSEILGSELFAPDKPLFGVQHPGRFSGMRAPFEKNPKSRACVGENDDLQTYWQGCFWGGRSEEFLNLCNELSSRTDHDLAEGIIAKWHDESHLNKYFIENKNIVKTLHPGYAYPESFSESFGYEKKIIHLDKNHAYMRNIEPASDSREPSTKS